MYKYRILKSSWGIAIDIDLSIQEYIINNRNETTKISENIYLYDKKKLTKQCKNIIIKALKDYALIIRTNVPFPEIMVSLEGLEIILTDYQDEGLYFAVQECISEKIGVEKPEYEVFFEKELNKYVFIKK